EPDDADATLLGEPGCCSECGSPFHPTEEQVSACSYGLWDTELGTVRGGTSFAARCPVCGVPLAARPGPSRWAELDPRSIRWQRDWHLYRIALGSTDAERAAPPDRPRD